MGKKLAPVEVSSFVGGYVSDANPLTFPPNASLDEKNMTLNLDGSRSRRLGMDFENLSTTISTTISTSSSPAHTTFKWENAGGTPENTFLVVQFGNEIKFFDFANSPLSSTVLFTYTFPISTISRKYSYAVVDGTLVIVCGEKNVYVFTYTAATGIVATTNILKIRDLFGVEDVVDGVDLRESNNVSTRPSSKTDTHIYNLRNQSWGVSRVVSTNGSDSNLAERDPLDQFQTTVGKYPSNSDSVNQALYANVNMTNNRTIDRFCIEDIQKNPIGTTHAACGYFIIDALERGTSRQAVYAEMMTKYPTLTINITSLPLDKTSGGPSVIQQYAGRVWYAGFQGSVTGGDKKSPKLSSYLLFSQLVKDPTNTYKCYQEGDLTSKDAPDLLDSDGGFIRINEAFGICSLKVTGNSLFVLAKNGIWHVTGNLQNGGFTANSYSVNKISEIGCQGASSVILAEGIIFYWGYDGIYAIKQSDMGDWTVVSVVAGKIQDFYNLISASSKESAQGFYDSYEHNIRWVYDNIVDSTTTTKELVFSLPLKAFSLNHIKTTSTGYPKLTGIYESTPYTITPGTDNVLVGGVTSVVGIENVVIGTQTNDTATREINYVCVVSTTPYITYRFATYKDTSFTDWMTYNGTGVDADGFIVTGYVSGGDFQRQKQAPMMTIYMNKTETGYALDSNGDMVPLNTSSCLTQVQWEWTDSADSNRWGTQFQAYRHKTLYLPDTLTNPFSNGFEVVTTKNKIRGIGRVLSVKFSTEPKKDLQLLGWSFMLGIETNV